MLFDYNKSGTIYARDIGQLCDLLDSSPSQAEIQRIMTVVQENGSLLNLSVLKHFSANHICL